MRFCLFWLAVHIGFLHADDFKNNYLRGSERKKHIHWPLLSDIAMARVSADFMNIKIADQLVALNADHFNQMMADKYETGSAIYVDTVANGWINVNATMGQIVANHISATAEYSDGKFSGLVNFDKNAGTGAPGIMVEVLVDAELNLGPVGRIKLPVDSVWVHIESIAGSGDIILRDNWLALDNFSLDFPEIDVTLNSAHEANNNQPSFGLAIFKAIHDLTNSLLGVAKNKIQDKIRDELPEKVEESIKTAIHKKIQEYKDAVFADQIAPIKLPEAVNLNGQHLRFGAKVSRLIFNNNNIMAVIKAGFSKLGLESFVRTNCFNKPNMPIVDWESDSPIAMQVDQSLLHQMVFEIWQANKFNSNWNSDMPEFKNINLPMVESFDFESELTGPPNFQDCFVVYRVDSKNTSINGDVKVFGAEQHMEAMLEAEAFAVPEYTDQTIFLTLNSLDNIDITMQDPPEGSSMGDLYKNLLLTKFMPQFTKAITGRKLFKYKLPEFQLPGDINMAIDNIEFDPRIIRVMLHED